MYQFNSESQKFTNHGSVPLDSNLTATSIGNDFYVLGELLHTSVKTNQLKVFKYNLKLTDGYSWVAIMKKTWSQPVLTSESDVKEMATSYKPHMVIVGRKMKVLVQEFTSGNRPDLYCFTFDLDSNNCAEIEPTLLSLPILSDNQGVLMGLSNNSEGTVMLFRSSCKGDYSLCFWNRWKDEVRMLAFLPQLANTSAIYVHMGHSTESPNGGPDKPNQDKNLAETEAGSEDTLVKDETDLADFSSLTAKEYRSLTRADFQRYQVLRDKEKKYTSRFSADNISRGTSRRSSLTSAISFSSKASRKSRKGGKKSIASRAASLMTSLMG